MDPIVKVDPLQVKAGLSRLMQSAMGLCLLIVALVVSGQSEVAPPSRSAWTLAIAITGSLVVTYDRKYGAAGAGTLFLGIFGLFHSGLVIAYSVAGTDVLVGQGNNAWVTGDLRGAVTATVLGLLGFSSGYALLRFFLRNRRHRGKCARPSRRNWVAPVGVLTVLVGLGLMGSVLLGGGVGLDANYVEFLEATANSNYGFGTILFGIGVIFLVQCGGLYRVWGLVTFAVAGVLLLMMGNRGVVIFTSLALLYVLGRGRRLALRVALPGALLGLGLIAVLRQSRAYGFRGLLSGQWTFSPLEGMAEMGYSLYPVVVVERWMTVGGVEPRLGTTLIAVPLRYFERLVLGIEPPTPDQRLFNVEIYEQVGAIGGSPIAEGVRNGGLWFTLLFLFVIGIVICFVDSRCTSTGILYGAVLLLPLLFFTRNSFAPVVVQWVLGVSLVWIATRPRPAVANPTPGEQ